ncbi:MAG TPA: hypothetical protein VK154_06975 [Chitinophagales bacterium]|nr:hypothetical protein [Chitinophagales bacterium]
MKQLLFCIALLLTNCNSLFAQKQAIEVTTNLIAQRKWQQASHYIDSIIRKNPKDVDALMMKGNVILNCALDTTPPMQFVTEDDATIFTGSVGERPRLLATKTVYSVERIWKKCLLLDSTRADISKGLCSIYAMALMRDSLQKEIPRLMKIEKDDGEQAFRMCEYARKFKERNRFDEAMQVYQFIAKQYPALAGVRCDIASEYFYAGKMNESLAWLDSTYNFKTVDETSFLNGAFLYSLLGYSDDAQNVLNTYSNIYKRKMDGFYFGLRQFADTTAKYKETLRNFCNAVDSNAYYAEYYTAQRVLAVGDSFTVKSYKALIDDKTIPDYYKPLIHLRALRQHIENSCEPYLLFGIQQSSIKNFSSAVQYLEEVEHCRMEGPQLEYWMMHYAYALYMFGDKPKAADYFKPLLQSTNNVTSEVAKYFTAAIAKAEGKSAEADKLWGELDSPAIDSKYAILARWQRQAK